MIIIFGAGNRGNCINEKFFLDRDDVVFYDNDRRMWNTLRGGRKVIDLEEYMSAIKKSDTLVVLGTDYPSAPYFFKDTCEREGTKTICLDGDILIPFDLSKLPVFSFGTEKRVKEKMRRYEEIASDYKNKGEIKAFHHAEEYIEFYKRNTIRWCGTD